MSSSSLPPLGNLPHWSRVVSLDKARYPRSFPRDCLELQPSLPPSSPGGMESGPRRVSALERDLQFLQQQHTETLGKLHAEIEQLRRENKDLQYKLIMEPKQSRKGKTANHSNFLRSSGSKYFYKYSTNGSSTTSSASQSGHRISQQPSGEWDFKTPLLEPHWWHPVLLLVSLLHLKSVLKDIILNNNKITPETYILTKAYLTGTSRGMHSFKVCSVQIEGSKCFSFYCARPDAQPSAAERVMLPALKQSLGTSFAERQKRTQAMQKNRLRKVVN
ncbi:CC74B protein, partial [Atractosteus spatula]|nr:CC74B protein [Atractosteus spatula]